MLSVSVLTDFDGTIAEDLSDLIYKNFAGCGLKYAQLWAEGKISTQDEIINTFASIHATPDEIAAVLQKARFDSTFSGFANYLHAAGCELAIVSDGLEWAIRCTLEANGVSVEKIFANQIAFTPNDYAFEFPWFREDTPMSGVCKPWIIELYKQRGKKVIYIGDGRSDQEAARHADMVFARDDLMAFCRQEKIAAEPYYDFKDVLEIIKTKDILSSFSK